MQKELELWHFVREQLDRGESVMLLIVAKSSGSSPGRAGYKMAVAASGDLSGSIGGGVMEVSLVEQARAILSEPRAIGTGFLHSEIREQVHQKNTPEASGMICSGRQTVILKQLTSGDAAAPKKIIDALDSNKDLDLFISDQDVRVEETRVANEKIKFEKLSETQFVYRERLAVIQELIIIGGGHCSLALSELMAKLNFRISIFDDRPELNTIEKNKFADEIKLIENYDEIADHIPAHSGLYVVVMTLGYASDAVVIRKLIDRTFKYFGVLGSKAKMKTLLAELRKESFSKEKLSSIRTPIGLQINSRTPHEIAVSIAAEIVAVKNSAI